MKNNREKVILITMIMMIFGMVCQPAWASTEDEFSELLSEYESEAPNIESAELSSVITSEKEIEVYLKTNRNDIKKVVISGWSGGVYKDYLTSKTAIYDEMRNIYTVTFSFDEIVNTKTNKVDSKLAAEYYFDACVYANNGSMSYVNLDKVQYTETGIITATTTNKETNKTEIEVIAEKDGYVAVLNEGEEATENTTWQAVNAGEKITITVPENSTTNANSASTSETISVVDSIIAEKTQQVKVLYKSGTEVTGEDLNNGNVTENEVMLLADGDEIEDNNSEANVNMSNFQDNETFTFEISQNSGKNDWISYKDTPNILETTIQGVANTEATVTITVHTNYAGVLSFDYLVSSEEDFDILKINDGTTTQRSGQLDWEKFTEIYYTAPKNGIITITLTYSKDKNINCYEDKVAIRNLKFISMLPTNGKVTINEGAEFTNNLTVNLDILADGASEMLITEDNSVPEIEDAKWQAIKATTNYTFENTKDGEKTIYVWFKNEVNALSRTATTATIKVDTTAPTNTVPKIVETTSNTITVNLKQTDSNELKSVKYGYRINGSTDEYTWTDNIKINNTIDATMYIISGLTEITEYEIVTKVSDGVNEEVMSESIIVKTKILKDNITITKSPAIKTLNNVTVTINWNDTTYTHEYSIDNGSTWITEINSITTIELTENQTIYYRMKNDTYDTGVLECVVDNIDREGPKVEKIEVVSPETGTYGIGDEVTIQLTLNEEVIVVELPKLNINFGDGIAIPLTATENTARTITYKYTITRSDGGYLGVYGLEGGLLTDSVGNQNASELPELTGSKIFIENVAYIASKNKYYGTIQEAINEAETEATTIKIISKPELRETLVIKEGQNITIDLNGKAISLESEKVIVTAIENSGTLTIIDSLPEQIGKIIAKSKNKSAYTIINNPTGILNVKAGKIEAISNSNSVSIFSYAIYNKGVGTVTLGTNDNTMSIEKPEIVATAKMGYGLYIANLDGNLKFYDGIIKGTEKALSIVKGFGNYDVVPGYAEAAERRTENGINYEVLYLSNEAKVELTMNGKTVGYNSIIEAVAQIPRDKRVGHIKILGDQILTDIVKIYKGQSVEIDLNGYKITRIGNKNVYAFMNKGTLKVYDNSENKTGIIEAISRKDVRACAIYNEAGGYLRLYGGTLFASVECSGRTALAYGLMNNSTNISCLIISEALIYNEYSFLDTTNIETTSGKYLNQRYEKVNGVEYKVNYISEEPVIEMTVGDNVTYLSGINQAIKKAAADGNKATIKMLKNEEINVIITVAEGKNIELDLNGNEITSNMKNTIKNSGELTISNSSEEIGTIVAEYDDGPIIISNLANLTFNGGRLIGKYVGESKVTVEVIGIENEGDLQINGGEIALTNNSSKGTTHGVKNKKGSIIVNDVIIDSSVYSGKSYGIYHSAGDVVINGGTTIASIEINSNENYGVYISATGNIQLTGGVWKGQSAGLYIPAGMEINNSGSIADGKINIPENNSIASRLDGKYIVQSLVEENFVVELTIGETTNQYASISDAISNIPTENVLGKIKMIQNEVLSKQLVINSGQKVELDLNGKEIIATVSNNIINNGDLTINDLSEGKNGIIKTENATYLITNEGKLVINAGMFVTSYRRNI